MEFEKMTIAELEARKSAIVAEVEAPNADLDALENEARAIKAELEKREAKAKAEAEQRQAIADNLTEVKVIEERKDVKVMNNVEIRDTKEYIDAYAKYIKTNKDTEARALLTENVDGGRLPVPTFVYDEVKHAWETEGIMKLVRKAYLKGNVKVGFEVSASGAVKHTEGSGAVDAEQLVHGVINIVPVSIKKIVEMSDELLDMESEAFLTYIYKELAHHIAKKCADELIGLIEACGTANTSTSVAVPQITASASMGAIAQGLASLSDEAQNPVVVMNKSTWGAFKTAQYNGKFNADIFEGLDVEFNNSIKAYAVASTGDTFAIVGDFGQGALANLPNGEEIKFNFDDKTKADQDLIRIIGREYVGLGVVAPYAFVKLVK